MAHPACPRERMARVALDQPPEELGHRRRPCLGGRADDQRALVAPARLHRLRAADEGRGGDGVTEISDDATGQDGRCGTVSFVPGHLADHHAGTARSNACHPQCARVGGVPRVCRRVVRRGDGRCTERGVPARRGIPDETTDWIEEKANDEGPADYVAVRRHHRHSARSCNDLLCGP